MTDTPVRSLDAQIKSTVVEAGAFELTSITYDSTYRHVISTATVKWPDGSSGTFTTTSINSKFQAIDAFTVTHSESGKTFTQSAVTRDSAGLVTAKPTLSIT